METIYNWLLHNVGNEENDFTILNVERQTNTKGISSLDIMARTKDFRRVNLVVEPISSDSESGTLTDNVPGDSYTFTDEDQVIAYLSDGKMTESSPQSEGIRLAVTQLTDDADTLAFPPK